MLAYATIDRPGEALMTAAALDAGETVWAFDLGAVNAYLVDDGAVTLIDTGTPGSTDDLRGGLEEAGYEPGDVDRVLLTHFDVDHVGGLAGLDLDAPIHATEPDASYVDGSRTPPLASRKGLFQRLSGFLLTPPDAPIERVGDGERVGGFTAYHTPGHTPGHVAYHHPDLGVGILGDLVREDDGRLEAPPWFLTADTAENRRSIRELAGMNLEFPVACMGHGDPMHEGGDRALSDLAGRISG